MDVECRYILSLVFLRSLTSPSGIAPLAKVPCKHHCMSFLSHMSSMSSMTFMSWRFSYKQILHISGITMELWHGSSHLAFYSNWHYQNSIGNHLKCIGKFLLNVKNRWWSQKTQFNFRRSLWCSDRKPFKTDETNGFGLKNAK